MVGRVDYRVTYLYTAGTNNTYRPSFWSGTELSHSDNLKIGQFKAIQDQGTYGQLKAHWWFPIWLLLIYQYCINLWGNLYTAGTNNTYRPSFWSGTELSHSDDLEIGQFKAIQDQGTHGQLKAHWWQWPWTSTVQGHPRSKVVVLIASPMVVSYLTSIVSNSSNLKLYETILAPCSPTHDKFPRSSTKRDINTFETWQLSNILNKHSQRDEISSNHKIFPITGNNWGAACANVWFEIGRRNKMISVHPTWK